MTLERMLPARRTPVSGTARVLPVIADEASTRRNRASL
jgi:hypothetical protein